MRSMIVALALGACACGANPVGPSAVEALSFDTKSVQTVATSLRFTWIVNGRETTFPQYNGTVHLKMSDVAVVKAEGLDAMGNHVSLQTQVFEASGTWFDVGGLNPAASQTHVYPIEEGPYDPVVFTADADPGPGNTFIWGFVQVMVVTD